MKHEIPAPDLVGQYQNASKENRREQVLLAFEAEYDIDRPFEVEWGKDDTHFIYGNHIYFYKPQYPQGLDELVTTTLVSESPHLCEFEL
jgi:hypothetical protein